MTYLFDTDIISELRRPERVDRRAAAVVAVVPEEAIHLSAITVFELDLGVRSMERRDPDQELVMRDWLERIVIARHAAAYCPSTYPWPEPAPCSTRRIRGRSPTR